MTKVNVSYTNFSYGEISPKMYGRFDLAPFFSGHRRVENFLIESIGQATYRNGFMFAAETAGNNRAYLYEWKFNNELAFVLEFTDGKLRFYRNNGIVESGGSPYEVVTPYTDSDIFQLKFAQDGVDMYITHPSYNPKKLTYTSATSWALTDHAPIRESFANYQALTAATKANPCVITYTGADSFTNGDRIKITGVSGMTELNDEIFTIANVNVGAKTFELSGIDATGYTTYSSGGIIQEIVETAAPFLASGEYPSAVAIYENRLVYGGSTNDPKRIWGSRSDDFDDFTLGDEVTDGFQYDVGGDGNTIQWLRGTNKLLAIGTYGDVLQVTGGVDGVITPSSISVRPSNNYGVSNVNPIGINSQIFYLQSDSLTMRSFEFEFESDGYISRDRNVIAEHILRGGCSQISFQRARPNVVWGARNDGQLCGMTIEETENISGWSRHTTAGEFISSCPLSRSDNNNQLWVCVKRNINGVDKYYVEYMADTPTIPLRSEYFSDSETTDYNRFRNNMFEAQKLCVHLDSCLTFDGAQVGVDASSSVTPAATSGAGILFTASAAVFSSGDVGNQIWKKSITGDEIGRAEITAFNSTTEVVCTIIEEFDNTDAMAAGDWYLTASTVSGLSHLEGEEVSIVTDGGQHGKRTVSGGSVTLDRESSYVHVGFAYDGIIETNSLEGGGTNGTSQTKKKSVSSVGIRFLNSLFAKVGTSYYNLEQIYERTAAMRMDRPPLLFTGDKKVKIPNNAGDSVDGGWQRDKRVIIKQSEPFPCNVQLITPYMGVSNV